MQLKWQGSGVEEKAFDEKGRCIVEVDPRYFRPTEVETLLGDASKARDKLGWTPQTSFKELVREMAEADFKSAQFDVEVHARGHKAMRNQG
jgi:GDPmannose 4,6-dehydratase